MEDEGGRARFGRVGGLRRYFTLSTDNEEMYLPASAAPIGLENR
jgi:hypothetical protein